MPSIDYRALKELVSLRDVLWLLRWTPTTTVGDQLRGSCPLHLSLSPRPRSFAARGNAWYCHRCRKGGNQLDLWMELYRLTAHEAALELCVQLCRPVPYLAPARRAGRAGNRKRNQ